MKKITNDEIRAFHLTGRGLDELTPQGPMLPELLAGVDSAPAHNPAEAPLVGLRDLYENALREQRSLARTRFVTNVRYCRDRMQELLSLDDHRDPEVAGSPSTVSASLGRGISFFDSGALAVALQTSLTSTPVKRMDALRRKRCETACNALDRYLRDAATQPAYWEFPVADVGAIAFCERQLDILAETLRAIRVARLEVDAGYDPAIHDEAIARFTWESADAEEIAAMPAVLVVDTADRVADNSLTSFGRLLRSGLPMQILITCPHFYTGDLAFLAVAHREAFVMQSSVTCHDHLVEGLLDMTHTLRPAVAVVSIADPPLFCESRTFPIFVYDPEAGEDWVQRFKLHRIPAPDGPDVNAVHLAAMSPELCKQFRILPAEAWSKEQLELADYLRQYVKQAPLNEPFLWVVDEKGEKQRAIVTRELVHMARDRQKAWRLLEELSEAGKPPAPAVDTEGIKKEAAKAAIYQVVAMLTGGGGPPAAAAPAAAPGQQVSVAPQAAAPASAAPEAATVDAYIESGLCTSCNDCTKINSRMFLYNADRQAYLGDLANGTFAELVKAAEGCPARCIHPGAPRPGDRTATPQLIARAAKFN